VQAVSNRRVGKTEFLFHAIDLALATDKGHDEIDVLGAEMPEGAARKTPFDDRIARSAMETGNGQLGLTDWTTGWCRMHGILLWEQFLDASALHTGHAGETDHG
jgi:hypothetical protein